MMLVSNLEAQGIAVTSRGVGSLRVGMSLRQLQPKVAGLYDEVRKVFVPAHDDGELSDMVSPAYYYLIFKKDNKIVIKAALDKHNRTIVALYLLSPQFSYHGIRPGMSVHAALKTNPQYYVIGAYATCDFFQEYLKHNDVRFLLKGSRGQPIHTPYADNILSRSFDQWTRLDVTNNFFQPYAVVSAIFLSDMSYDPL